MKHSFSLFSLARIFHADHLRKPGGLAGCSSLDSHGDLGSIYSYSSASKCDSTLPHQTSRFSRHDWYRISRIVLFFLVGVMVSTFLSSCAQGPTVDPQVTAAVTAHHVPSETSNKMVCGQHLNYHDILNLVKSGVPSYIIVGYLRSTEVVYNFTYAQLRHLRAMGATPEVLNYLSETQGFYGNNKTPSPGFKIPKYIRVNSMLNQDKQPFFYNEPIVDDWYDSSYEESCYSPFSFN